MDTGYPEYAIQKSMCRLGCLLSSGTNSLKRDKRAASHPYMISSYSFQSDFGIQIVTKGQSQA